ncbi:hypothetical protein ACFL3F_04850 [Planctomycetota bacterium]
MVKGQRLIGYFILGMMIPTVALAQQIITIKPDQQVQVSFGMQVCQAEETLGVGCEARIIPWIEPLGSEKEIKCHGLSFTFSNDLLSALVYGKDYNYLQKITPFSKSVFNPPKRSKSMLRFGMPKKDIDTLIQAWKAKLDEVGFKEVRKEPVQALQYTMTDWQGWLKGSSHRTIIFGPGKAGMYIRYQARWKFVVDDQTGNLTEIHATSPWFQSELLRTFNMSHLPKTAGQASLPVNGTVKDYTTKERLAPLRVVTSGQKVHYLVKLSDWETDDIALTIFVHAGQTIETTIPLGSFRLKYAAGENWLGYDDLFGKDTIYSKANKCFKFVQQGDNISGYTVELVLQQGGNLSTARIPKSQW